jgi:hypothetical protein
MLAGKEERMSAKKSKNQKDKPEDQKPPYVFKGSTPAEEYLEIARIHRREAMQLFERANQAHAEDRQQEAMLLIDLGIARRERAEEFERAARGEGRDPVVDEILDWQQDLCHNYVPYLPEFVSPDAPFPEQLQGVEKSRPLGPIARAVAWVGSWIA